MILLHPSNFERGEYFGIMNQSGKATYISYHTRAEKEESCDEKGDSTKKNVNKSNVEEEKGFRILIGQFCLKIVIYYMPA